MRRLLSAGEGPLCATFTTLQYTLIEFLFRDRAAQTARGIQFTTSPCQRLDPSTFSSRTKRRRLHATKRNLQIPYLSLSPPPPLSLPPLRYPCQLLYHFNEYSLGNGLIAAAKYLFLSGVDLVCLKPAVRTDRLSARRSSKAMMLSDPS